MATDYEVIDEIASALRSCDPADLLGQATTALRIARQHDEQVGWRNPRTGALAREDRGGDTWQPVFVHG